MILYKTSTLGLHPVCKPQDHRLFTFLSSQLSANLTTLPPRYCIFLLLRSRKPCSTSAVSRNLILLPGGVLLLYEKQLRVMTRRNYCRLGITEMFLLSLLFVTDVTRTFFKKYKYFPVLFLAILAITRCKYQTV